MNNELSELEKVFYAECIKRMKRALGRVMACQNDMTPRDYDYLYQEFDTLYGGAKAAYLTDLESFFLTIAIYVKFLKRSNSAAISEKDVAMILEGINLTAQCGEEEWFTCLASKTKQLHQFINQLNFRMGRL